MKKLRACAQCPFRTDVPAYITRERAAEIASALEHDRPFHCHKTVDYDEDEDGETVASGGTWCIGAAATMHRTDELRGNLSARLAEQLGFLSIDALDLDAPLSRNLAEWVERHSDRKRETR